MEGIKTSATSWHQMSSQLLSKDLQSFRLNLHVQKAEFVLNVLLVDGSDHTSCHSTRICKKGNVKDLLKDDSNPPLSERNTFRKQILQKIVLKPEEAEDNPSLPKFISNYSRGYLCILRQEMWRFATDLTAMVMKYSDFSFRNQTISVAYSTIAACSTIKDIWNASLKALSLDMSTPEKLKWSTELLEDLVSTVVNILQCNSAQELVQR